MNTGNSQDMNRDMGRRDTEQANRGKVMKESLHGEDVKTEEPDAEAGKRRSRLSEDLWDTLEKCRRKASACDPGLRRSYMEYELNYIDDQLSHLKERMESFLASADAENEKRGRELRQENTLFLRYLIIKEYFFGSYELSQRGV